MTPFSELFSPESIHEAVASFNFASLSLFFDVDHFPFTDVQENFDSGLAGSRSRDPAELDRWTVALRNIPTPILAHELSHAIQTATTPSGLKDFFQLFVAEYRARAAIEDALRVIPGAVLPLGLHTILSGSDSHPSSGAYRESLALQHGLALRLGGLRVPLNEDTVERLDALNIQPGNHLLVNAEASSITLLGARHVYEGFGAAVQMIRAALDGNPIDPVRDFPDDPYTACLAQYLRLRPISDGGSLYEFAIVLDTALLEDQWFNLDQEERLPARTFFRLLDVLQRNPELRLVSMSLGDVTSFQNDLMRLSGFAVPDVGEICNGLHERLPSLFEEIKSISSLPEVVLDDYYKCIDTLQQFRLEKFGGACTLELLVFGARSWFAALISNLPSGTNGPEIPLVEGDTAYRIAFTWQKAKHAAAIFDEVVFGHRRCPVEHNCILPRRPACSGVTDELSPRQERCARESLIDECMSAWHIDRFEQD